VSPSLATPHPVIQLVKVIVSGKDHHNTIMFYMIVDFD